jgi:uncharacterized membrane protein YdbT with pleckstrin-like domain
MEKTSSTPNLLFFYFDHFLYLIFILLVFLLISIFLFYSSSINLILFLGSIILILIIFLASLVYSYLFCKNTVLSLDNNFLVYETGIIKHEITSVPINNVTDFSFKQGVIQKIFNVATLSINTSGGQGFEIIASNFDFPSLAKIHSHLKSKKQSK